MSTYALICGVIFKPAEEKTSSKTGRTFVSATVKCGETGDVEFWSITAFSQSAQSELMRLGAGDALSVQGKAKIELWHPRDGGEVKISRSLFADAVLPLRSPPRERRAKAAASTPLLDQPASQGHAEQSTTDKAPSSFFDEEIPF